MPNDYVGYGMILNIIDNSGLFPNDRSSGLQHCSRSSSNKKSTTTSTLPNLPPSSMLTCLTHPGFQHVCKHGLYKPDGEYLRCTRICSNNCSSRWGRFCYDTLPGCPSIIILQNWHETGRACEMNTALLSAAQDVLDCASRMRTVILVEVTEQHWYWCCKHGHPHTDHSS